MEYPAHRALRILFQEWLVVRFAASQQAACRRRRLTIYSTMEFFTGADTSTPFLPIACGL